MVMFRRDYLFQFKNPNQLPHIGTMTGPLNLLLRVVFESEDFESFSTIGRNLFSRGQGSEQAAVHQESWSKIQSITYSVPYPDLKRILGQSHSLEEAKTALEKYRDEHQESAGGRYDSTDVGAAAAAAAADRPMAEMAISGATGEDELTDEPTDLSFKPLRKRLWRPAGIMAAMAGTGARAEALEETGLSVLAPLYGRLLPAGSKLNWHLNTWFAGLWETTAFFLLPMLDPAGILGNFQILTMLLLAMVAFPLSHFLLKLLDYKKEAKDFWSKSVDRHGWQLVWGSLFVVPFLAIIPFAQDMASDLFWLTTALAALVVVALHSAINIKAYATYSSLGKTVESGMGILEGSPPQKQNNPDKKISERVAKMREKYDSDLKKQDRLLILDLRQAGQYPNLLKIYKNVARAAREASQEDGAATIQFLVLTNENQKMNLEFLSGLHPTLVTKVGEIYDFVRNHPDSIPIAFTSAPKDFDADLIHVVNIAQLLSKLIGSAAFSVHGAAALMIYDMIPSDVDVKVKKDGSLYFPAQKNQSFTDKMTEFTRATEALLRYQ